MRLPAVLAPTALAPLTGTRVELELGPGATGAELPGAVPMGDGDGTVTMPAGELTGVGCTVYETTDGTTGAADETTGAADELE